MDRNMNRSSDKVIVEIDADLQDLIPGYLLNKQKEIDTVTAALSINDFETIRIIGHSVKGNGSAYGFERITEIGQALEHAAKSGMVSEISQCIADLQNYLNQVTVVYIEDN